MRRSSASLSDDEAPDLNQLILLMTREKIPPLQAGLLTALQALDSQIAREMQRQPAEIEVHGVQKWEPISKRVETIAGFLLDAIESQAIELDSVLTLSQAVIKTLSIIVQDLGEKGLGKMRSAYALEALQNIERDARAGLGALRDTAVIS